MTAAISRLAEPAADAAIAAATKTLQLPTIRAQFGTASIQRGSILGKSMTEPE